MIDADARISGATHGASAETPGAALPVHGGDLAAIGRRYGIDPATLLDFSANLNPLGPPASLLAELAAAASDVAGLARYPDPHVDVLRDALARELRIDRDAIVVANGAAALFDAALRGAGARRCVVPTPCFSEYRHAVANAGATFVRIAQDEARGFGLDGATVVTAARAALADACIIANPQNPTGALASQHDVRALWTELRSLDVTTIVDEAFIDFAPDASVTHAAAAGDGTLVVVRSLTKFYAVPALRVGYAVTAPWRAQRLRAALPSWPVTTLAARALAAALSDTAYRTRTLAANVRAREGLGTGLTALGFALLRPAANFIFARLPADAPRAPELIELLVRDAGIVVRDCRSYDGLEAGDHVRIAVRDHGDNRRLLVALTALLEA